ncbi:MAG: hypothetical protein LBH24_05115 [Clostridiales bacterium]|jgi:hypothetical protein|nr:hypothetical protein [Clostridiales bacterium]
MLYIRMTLKYCVKNFPRLILAAAPLVVAAAFLLNPVNVFVYGERFAPEGLDGFRHIFFWLFRREIVGRWYQYAIAFVLHFLTCCFLIAIVEKDFKVGRLSVRSPFYSINNTFPPVFKTYLVVFVAVLLFKSLLMCVLTLFSTIFLSAGMSLFYSDVILAAAAFLLCFFFVILLRTVFLTVGTMLLYGYGFRESYGVTLKFCVKKKGFYVAASLALPLLTQFALDYLMALTGAPDIVYYFVDALLLGLGTIYVCVTVMTAVYDITGIERRDMRPAYQTK